jgi:hypothetical protein
MKLLILTSVYLCLKYSELYTILYCANYDGTLNVGNNNYIFEWYLTCSRMIKVNLNFPPR